MSPIAGAAVVFVLAVAMGAAFAGWHSRTAIDLRTQTVTDDWSIFGLGPRRRFQLSEFDRVIVRRWVRWNGRIRRRVILGGEKCQVELAGFYTLKGARESGQKVAAFCRLPLEHDDRLPRFWST